MNEQIKELEAEVERLRSEVPRAYMEGWNDEVYCDAVSSWQASEARKRLEPPNPGEPK